MSILAESYITPVFTDAARLSQEERCNFLSTLRDTLHIRDGKDDAIFCDTTVFCVNTADVPLHAFSRHMVISANVLRLWTNGQNLPYERNGRATQMIDVALYQNGFIGKPPRRPVTDGSNVVQLRPHAPH